MAFRATAALASEVAPYGGLPRPFSTTSTSSFFAIPQTTQATPAREQAEPNANPSVSSSFRLSNIKFHFLGLASSPVFGLNKRTSEGLREAFSAFGEVVHARVVTDEVSGYFKGFGFVKYATLEDTAKGIAGMDAKNLEGRFYLLSMQDPDSLLSLGTTWVPHAEAT